MKKLLGLLLTLMMILTVTGCGQQKSESVVGYKEVAVSGDSQDYQKNRVTTTYDLDGNILVKITEVKNSSNEYVITKTDQWFYRDGRVDSLVEDNKVSGLTIFTNFNQEGLAQSQIITESNEQKQRLEMIYNENGNLLESYTFNETDQLINSTIYTYYLDGKIASEVTEDENGKVTLIYLYDNEGQLYVVNTSIEYPNEDFEYFETVNTVIELKSFDDKGRIVLEGYKDKETDLFTYLAGYQYDDNDRVISQNYTYYEGENIVSEEDVTYEYSLTDEGKLAGFVRTTVFTTPEATTNSRIVHTYDNQERIIKVEIYNEQQLVELFEVTYSEIFG